MTLSSIELPLLSLSRWELPLEETRPMEAASTARIRVIKVTRHVKDISMISHMLCTITFSSGEMISRRLDPLDIGRSFDVPVRQECDFLASLY